MKFNADAHVDWTGGAPLVCGACHAEQSLAETERDPLMYLDPETFQPECDRCRELRSTWAQECAVSRWEDEQR